MRDNVTTNRYRRAEFPDVLRLVGLPGPGEGGGNPRMALYLSGEHHPQHASSRGAHEHPSLTSPDDVLPGNGLLLFFRVDDFERALRRARGLVARLDEGPHANPQTRTREFALHDPDGYYVTISELPAG